MKSCTFFQTEEKQMLSSLWTKVLHACNTLGISAEESMALWAVLAAIIHLGAAGATKGTNGRELCSTVVQILTSGVCGLGQNNGGGYNCWVYP